MLSSDMAESQAPRDRGPLGVTVPRMQYVPREDGAVVFRCEACQADIHDLRGVHLAYRTEQGWLIECARHEEAFFSVDAGCLFGGGMHAVEILGQLACAKWFAPDPLFRAFLRLRAQARGLYLNVKAASGS